MGSLSLCVCGVCWLDERDSGCCFTSSVSRFRTFTSVSLSLTHSLTFPPRLLQLMTYDCVSHYCRVTHCTFEVYSLRHPHQLTPTPLRTTTNWSFNLHPHPSSTPETRTRTTHTHTTRTPYRTSQASSSPPSCSSLSDSPYCG